MLTEWSFAELSHIPYPFHTRTHTHTHTHKAKAKAKFLAALTRSCYLANPGCLFTKQAQ